MSNHPNLSLARELICSFVRGEVSNINATQNNHLLIRLDAGYSDDAFNALPGTTHSEICANLQTVFRLASDPVPMPLRGRNQQGRQWASQRQRERIKLCARVCLVLLGANERGGILRRAI